MSTPVLELRSLHVQVADKPVLHDVSLRIPAGQTHVLFGPNGSGKSSLLAAIMGLPPYVVTAGEILLDGRRIERLPIDQRARAGLGMAFQRPPRIEGVSVGDFGQALQASARLAGEAAALDLTGFAGRELNVGFSGGETKRWEILKLFLQRPRMCLLDEPESGVDLEHIAAVGAAIRRLLAGEPGAGARSALVITHTGFILEHIAADVGHVMVDGRILYSGDPNEIFAHIRRNGYGTPLAARPQSA